MSNVLLVPILVAESLQHQSNGWLVRKKLI